MLKIKTVMCMILCIFIMNLNIGQVANAANSSGIVVTGTEVGNSDMGYTEEVNYYDIDSDGVYEKIVKNIADGTSQMLSYYIYKNGNLIWSRENLYKGKVSVLKETVIETVPIYNEGDSNSSPSNIRQTTFKLINNLFINAGYLEYSNSAIENKTPMLASIYYKNPNKIQIESLLESIADEKGIPRAILKAIAWQESRGTDADNNNTDNWRQFKNGQPLISYDGKGIGIMQVSDYDMSDISEKNLEYINRLKYDIEFNIREGANILLSKWVLAYSSPIYKTPKIGNMEVNYLEHWYYAIWAYNKYSTTNNPANYYDTAYQTLVIKHVNTVFNIKMTDLYLYDSSLFTKDILPREDIPEINSAYLNSVPLKKISSGVNYIVDASFDVEKSGLKLRDNNMNLIGTYSKGTIVKIIDGPLYNNGYTRYNVQIGDKIGSVATMYLKPPGNLNNDNIIDVFDFVQISKKLDTTITLENAKDLRKYDINYDNIIDIKDVAAVSLNYNKKLYK